MLFMTTIKSLVPAKEEVRSLVPTKEKVPTFLGVSHNLSERSLNRTNVIKQFQHFSDTLVMPLNFYGDEFVGMNQAQRIFSKDIRIFI